MRVASAAICSLRVASAAIYSLEVASAAIYSLEVASAASCCLNAPVLGSVQCYWIKPPLGVSPSDEFFLSYEPVWWLCIGVVSWVNWCFMHPCAALVQHWYCWRSVPTPAWHGTASVRQLGTCALMPFKKRLLRAVSCVRISRIEFYLASARLRSLSFDVIALMLVSSLV